MPSYLIRQVKCNNQNNNGIIKISYSQDGRIPAINSPKSKEKTKFMPPQKPSRSLDQVCISKTTRTEIETELAMIRDILDVRGVQVDLQDVQQEVQKKVKVTAAQRRQVRFGTPVIDPVEDKVLASTEVNRHTYRTFQQMGLELVERQVNTVTGLEGDGVTPIYETVTVRRVHVQSNLTDHEKIQKAEALAEIINTTLDEFYVHQGYDASQRLGIEQVDVIMNMAFGTRLFHKVTAGGGKNDAIFPLAAVINQKVNKTEGLADWLGSRAVLGLRPARKAILVLHNVNLFEETQASYADDSNLWNFITGSHVQVGETQEALKIAFLTEEALRQVRDPDVLEKATERGETPVPSILEEIQGAHIILAQGTALDFLNNEHRDYKNPTEVRKAVEVEARGEILGEVEEVRRVEKRSKAQEMTKELWELIFKQNRFVFDEADTSLKATGVQK